MRPRRPEQTPPPSDIEETALADDSLRPPANAQVTRLVIVYPRTQAGVYLLGDVEAVLGRHPGPAIPVAVMHPTVSRRHAVFRWDPGARRHTVADLGSRNGTWLNGQTVSTLPRHLDDQAVLRIGSVIAIYERQDPAAIDPPGIDLTPLRARRADMLASIDRLHAAWAAQRQRSDLPPLEFQPDAAEALLLRPGLDDLRGLQRFVHACAAIADPVPIHLAELGPWLAPDLPLETSILAVTPVPASLRNNRPRPTREALLAILTSNGWSIRATAKHYERDRKQISRWIEMYVIEMPGRTSE